MANSTARQAAMMEYSSMGLETHSPLGMYCTPQPENVLKWACVLFIHRGYYAGAVLHFTLTIPSTYPSQGPSVHFQTDVVHPLIDPSSGKFALGGRFPTWRTGKDYLFMVLFYVKSSFKREALDRLREAGCANLEAYRLYRDQTPLFTHLASQSSTLSRSPASLFPPTSSSSSSTPLIQFKELPDFETQSLRSKVEEGARTRLVPKQLS